MKYINSVTFNLAVDNCGFVSSCVRVCVCNFIKYTIKVTHYNLCSIYLTVTGTVRLTKT